MKIHPVGAELPMRTGR